MTQEDEKRIDYIDVVGPTELWDTLLRLLEKTRQENLHGPAEYYLRYSLGQQLSYIKVDLNADPIQFWYYDSLGRPMTNAVKETIAKFLWEKGGVSEHYTTTTKEE